MGNSFKMKVFRKPLVVSVYVWTSEAEIIGDDDADVRITVISDRYKQTLIMQSWKRETKSDLSQCFDDVF